MFCGAFNGFFCVTDVIVQWASLETGVEFVHYGGKRRK